MALFCLQNTFNLSLFHLQIYSISSDNDFHRTLLCTFTAVCTLLIVNDRYIVVHMDGVKFALLGAQGTADTAVIALCFYFFALIMGITLNQMLCVVRH